MGKARDWRLMVLRADGTRRYLPGVYTSGRAAQRAKARQTIPVGGQVYAVRVPKFTRDGAR